MTRTKRRTAALILSFCLLCTGCWDRLEVNDIAIVMTTAIDLEEDGRYRLTLQYALPGEMGGSAGGGGGTGGTKAYYLDSEVGRTAREAADRLQRRTSRRLFFSHRRVFIVGEAMARAGITPVFDVVARLPENRLTAQIVVSQGNAYELLKTEPSFERWSGESIREISQGKGVISKNIKNAAMALGATGSDMTLLYMKAVPAQSQDDRKDEIGLVGYAQFKGDRMVDQITGDAAVGLLIVKGQPTPVEFTIPLESGGLMSLMLYEWDTSVTPLLKEDKPHFDLHITAKIRIVEAIGSGDLSRIDAMHQLKAGAARHIEQATADFLDQVKANKADSADFGNTLYRRYPRPWKRTFEERWPDLLADAEFRINVDIAVVQPGLITHNIGSGGQA